MFMVAFVFILFIKKCSFQKIDPASCAAESNAWWRQDSYTSAATKLIDLMDPDEIESNLRYYTFHHPIFYV